MTIQDRRIHLKIKIKHLTFESKLIRAETKKRKAMAKKCREKGQPDFAEQHHNMAMSLSSHRRWTVRRAARNAHLAHMCIKGTPYHKVERKCREEPNWDEIERMAMSFGVKYLRWINTYSIPYLMLEDYKKTKEAFIHNWLNEAQEYYERTKEEMDDLKKSA